jgi:hypothetical protein
MNMKEISEHLEKHVVYPASKSQIIEACNRMDDVPKDDRESFERCLPDRIYNNSNEVVKAFECCCCC